jgi:hypothetical protein
MQSLKMKSPNLVPSFEHTLPLKTKRLFDGFSVKTNDFEARLERKRRFG